MHATGPENLEHPPALSETTMQAALEPHAQIAESLFDPTHRGPLAVSKEVRMAEAVVFVTAMLMLAVLVHGWPQDRR